LKQRTPRHDAESLSPRHKADDHYSSQSNSPFFSEPSWSISTSSMKVHDNLQAWGINFANMNRSLLLVILSVGHIASACVFAALQEKCFSVIDKSYSQVVTLGTQITLCVAALLERYLDNDLTVRAPMKSYVILSFLTSCGMGFTNWSLNYLSYPARIIFKSAKSLPTMAIESILPPRKRFTFTEFVAVILLTVGIGFFSMGEVKGTGGAQFMGYLLILIGVTADALTSNFEKKNIFKKHDSSHAEVMFFASLFGVGWTSIGLIASPINILSFLTGNPWALVYIFCSGLGAYMSVSFVLLIIKAFGPTYAEIIKGLRRVISITGSYIFFPRPDKSFGQFHFIGVCFFTLSIIQAVYNKSQRSNR